MALHPYAAHNGFTQSPLANGKTGYSQVCPNVTNYRGPECKMSEIKMSCGRLHTVHEEY